MIGNYLLQCLNHILDRNWARSAELSLYRYDQCLINDPTHLSIVHICRNDAKHAFPCLSGNLMDFMEVNPNYSAFPIKSDYKSWQEAAKTFAYACESAEPRPVLAVLDTSAFNQTQGFEAAVAFRKKACAILRKAPKGILYRQDN